MGLGASNMRKKRTNTLGRKAVCFRIHIGAINPSGWRGEEGVSGERGECAEGYEGSSGETSLRGGKRTFLSTRTMWNEFDRCGDHMDGRWDWRVSRRRDMRRANGSDEAGSTRPATNMTGASWNKSSTGYAFMILQGKARRPCPFSEEWLVHL